MQRIKAKYLIETAFPLEEAAEMMAGEQSCGTFIKTPGETIELRKNHAASVEKIELQENVDSPTLKGSKLAKSGHL